MNGIIREYSTNNTNNQVKVSGWKQIVNQNNTIVKYNGELVFVRILGNFSCSAWAQIGATIPSGYRPGYSIKQFRQSGSVSADSCYLENDGRVISPIALSNAGTLVTFLYPPI